MQLNKFFVHKINKDKYALITDVGNWTDVSKKELDSIKENKIEKQLQKRLESKKIILTNKNKPSIQKDYTNLFSHLTHGVSLHIVNPTMRCNLNCLYCYADSSPITRKGFDMDEETAKKTIDFIWQSPRKNFVIEFQGGEPLANFSTIQFIINYVANKRPKKNVHWRMVSNLSLMDETIATWLKKNNVNDLCTSLDGPKKVHDYNRPLHGGSHSKVVHWLSSLKQDFGFKNIGTLCTVTKHSLPFAREIVEEHANLGLPDITPVPVRSIGRAKKNWNKIGFSADEYSIFWKKVVEQCFARTKKGKPMTEQFSLMIAQKLQGTKPAFHACFSKPCGGALMQASYQPDGEIYTCDEGKALPLFKIGTVNQKYSKVFTSPNALNMISLSSSLGLLCNECKWTAYCCFCPVMAYSSQNSPIPLLYNNMDCKIRQSQFEYVFEKLFSKDRSTLLQWLGKGKSL
ncbi:MAG: hypothetical protein CL943_01255 [Candidatus Diapherotrites archaeon]|uniref:Radical SAM core domain-containing protein n=1 Tax=Candidatus Iainarchaeum sp. TaxID=3101447 RepID=A0A2D6M0L0_9ARCH|nr:hypothetical protein [Candidatus Diapherotrites archaeon]|tara:strand:- start:699 stop:2072 length:1374 start_codon:yes stop_codon:yes gene_type:complete